MKYYLNNNIYLKITTCNTIFTFQQKQNPMPDNKRFFDQLLTNDPLASVNDIRLYLKEPRDSISLYQYLTFLILRMTDKGNLTNSSQNSRSCCLLSRTKDLIENL